LKAVSLAAADTFGKSWGSAMRRFVATADTFGKSRGSG
jgi:hypothetical protein